MSLFWVAPADNRSKQPPSRSFWYSFDSELFFRCRPVTRCPSSIILGVFHSKHELGWCFPLLFLFRVLFFETFPTCHLWQVDLWFDVSPHWHVLPYSCLLFWNIDSPLFHVSRMHFHLFIHVNCILRSMFRNVLSALNEALDITLHLHPLIEHFQVDIIRHCYL